MAKKTAVLAVKIISDAKSASAGLDGLGKKTGKLAGGLKLLGGAALGAFAAFGGAVVKGIGDAGDLEQSIGAVDAVFKGNAKQVHAWASSAATDVGLTRNEFNELATLIGAQLKNGGTAMDELGGKTNDLIRLGADMSAMFGGTTAEAVEALSSALKGERDPIERYGVTLRQSAIDAKAAELGFKKVGGTFDTNAQQAATLALIMDQTRDAQGTFARETSTLAHQQQVLKAKLGDASAALGMVFLPAATAVMTFLADKLAPALRGLIGWLQPVGDAIKRALGGLSGPLAAAGAPLDKFRSTASGIAAAVQTNIVPAFNRFKETIAGWAAAARPIIDQITSFIVGKLGEWAPQIQSTFSTVTEIIGGALDLVTALIGPWVQGAIGWWNTFGGTILEIVGTAFSNVQTSIGTALKVVSGIIKTITSLIKGDWSGAWNAIKGTFTAAWNGIKTIGTNNARLLQSLLSRAWSGISSAASSAWNGIKNTVTTAWNNLVAAIRTGVSNAVQTVRELPGRVVSALSGIASRLTQTGRDMIQGMINGIRQAAGRLISEARSVVSNAWSAAKNVLGIRSPSRKWAYLGDQSVAGLTGALKAGRDKAAKAAQLLADAATSDVTIPINTVTTTAGTRTRTTGPGSAAPVTININVDGALDARSTAAQIRRILNSDARIRGVVDLAGTVLA